MTRVVVPSIGAFEVSALPGQPQVAHCHALFVVPEVRGNGLGKVLKEAQNRYLKEHMYDYALCTVRGDNAAQRKILKSAGWKQRDSFYDSRQDAVVELWSYDVEYETEFCEWFEEQIRIEAAETVGPNSVEYDDLVDSLSEDSFVQTEYRKLYAKEKR